MSRRTDRLPALAVLENGGDQRLLLQSAGGQRWLRLRRACRRLWPDQRRPGRAMALDRLSCDRSSGLLQLQERRRWLSGGRLRSLRCDQIETVRLRVVERSDSELLLELTVVVGAGGEPLGARFAVRDLDRDDEALDLGLRIGRCLGLAVYRIRQPAPADIELARSAGQKSPFRTSWLPIPPAGEPIDYRARSAAPLPAELPPATDAAGRRQIRLDGGWHIEEWNPGQRIEIRRTGRSALGSAAAVVAATPWLAIKALLVALAITLVVVVALAVVFSVLVFIASVTDDALGKPMQVDARVPYVLDGLAIFVGLVFVGVVAVRLVGAWVDSYRDARSRTRTLDWQRGEYAEYIGRARRDATPLAGITAAALRPRGEAPDGTPVTAIELLTAGLDRELCRWHDDTSARLMEPLFAALAAALEQSAAGDEP